MAEMTYSAAPRHKAVGVPRISMTSVPVYPAELQVDNGESARKTLTYQDN